MIPEILLLHRGIGSFHTARAAVKKDVGTCAVMEKGPFVPCGPCIDTVFGVADQIGDLGGGTTPAVELFVGDPDAQGVAGPQTAAETAFVPDF